MSLTAFARHLRASKEATMRRWQEAVCQLEEVPSARGLPEPQLWNHLPALLDEVASAVEGAVRPSVEANGQEHGRQRWGSGYNLGEMLRELSLLRHVLLQVAEEYFAGEPKISRKEQAEALRRMHEVIDRCGQSSAVQYHGETLTVRRLQERELQEASMQKDRFLAILSHELRNPLAAILTAVQLLELTEAGDPRVRRARETIERQARHQTRLIEDLLDMNRLAQEKMALRLEVHDLQAAVRYAVEGVSAAIAEKGQALQVALTPEPLSVNADPVRLEQVVTNLLTNASRYTDPGGTISLAVERQGGDAVLRVRDTGIGIAPEMLPRVFNLFTQADLPQVQSQGGLGIGLSLVKSLVELHGGTVAAYSDGPGTGSEFTVRLPLASVAAMEANLPTGTPQTPSAARRVVVVEHNRDSRVVLAELLELLGHEVVTAADGAEALRLARERRPEAFVVNVKLPGMNGYELARTLRQAPGGNALRLIALADYDTPEEQEQTREAGFDAHLAKPADIEELQRLLLR